MARYKIDAIPEDLRFPITEKDERGRRIPFLTVSEAAPLYGIGEEALRRRLQRGGIPHVQRRDGRRRMVYLIPVYMAEMEASFIAAKRKGGEKMWAAIHAHEKKEAAGDKTSPPAAIGRSVNPDKPCVEPSPKPSTMGREDYMRRRKAGEDIPADQIPPPMSREEYGRRVRRGEDIPAELAPPPIVDLGPGWIPAGDPTITIPTEQEASA